LTTNCKRPAANRLIAGLPKRELDGLLDHCELVELSRCDELSSQEIAYSHAWFPLSALISVKASVNKHPAMEVGMIGHEGMLGVTLLLDVDQAPHQALVMGSGSALRISRTAFHDFISTSPALLQGIKCYSFQLMMQMTQTTLCTHFHRIEERLARWLLMAHDRIPGDHFSLTHQLLANMLGVRRSAVTLASGILKKKGLISYSRGRISILDRHGLETIACECYSALPS